jgi:hypothetical protein
MRVIVIVALLLAPLRSIARDAPEAPAGSRTNFVRDGVRYSAVPIRIGAKVVYACCKTEPEIP